MNKSLTLQYGKCQATFYSTVKVSAVLGVVV